MAKDFLTYEEQIEHLEKDKKINCKGDNAKSILCKNGYFNIVNGYKEPFVQGRDKNNDHIYIGGTTIQDLFEVKRFDEELRMCLLRYITKVEEEVRTIFGYKFDQYNNNGEIKWDSIDAYELNNNIQYNNIQYVIERANKELESLNQKAYINHYLEKYNFIPTWILTKAINFSTLIDLIKNSKKPVKDSLCSLYGLTMENKMPDYALLIGSLNWIRQVRNACAHNERIYDLTSDGRRKVEKYIKMLPASYKKDKRKILDVIVYLRYYLNDEDFSAMLGQIKNIMQDLLNKIPETPFNKIRADMGIKDMKHLDILLSTKKEIDYNNL